MPAAYTPVGILIDAGFDEDEVLTLRASAKAAIVAGAERITSYSADGASVTRVADLTPIQIAAECRYALEILNPETYAQDVTPNYARVSF